MKFEQQIEQWLSTGKIKREKPHRDQIKVLLEKAQKDLNTAHVNLSIDLENSFNLAYNSMLKTGRALILSKGYRTIDGYQHKTTVEFCGFFINNKDLIATYDHMRRARNTLIYDPFDFSDFEKEDVENAIDTAKSFLKAVKGLL